VQGLIIGGVTLSSFTIAGVTVNFKVLASVVRPYTVL
jgi:hypothetical protein